MKKNILYLLFVMALMAGGCESSVVPDPSTVIQYTIPQNSNVKVTVENSYHTVVSVLIDSPHAAGIYSIKLDSLSLPEGVYFYTVEIKGDNGYYSKTTHPMLLVK